MNIFDLCPLEINHQKTKKKNSQIGFYIDEKKEKQRLVILFNVTHTLSAILIQ